YGYSANLAINFRPGHLRKTEYFSHFFIRIGSNPKRIDFLFIHDFKIGKIGKLFLTTKSQGKNLLTYVPSLGKCLILQK
ncbi:MAG TPA: hypothetical protein VLS85_08845, partial [Hanamia sp.]|nr:hypothetical protein [Hanamia sp.]